MKRLIKFGSIGFVIVGAIVSGANDVSAIPASFIQFTPAGQRLGISGTPASVKSVTITGSTVPRTSTVRVNSCGFTKITNPSGFTEGDISIFNGGTFNVASVKSSAAIPEPTCSSIGVAANIPTTPGAYNVGKGAIVYTGLPVSRVLDLSYTSSDPITRNVTLNACGYGIVNVSAGGLFSVDGSAPADLSSLQKAEYSCSGGVLFARIFGPFSGVSNAVPITPLADVSRDSAFNLIVKVPRSATSSVVFDNASFTRSATSDRCSGLYLPATTTGIVKINGVSVDTSAIPTRSSQESCAVRPDGSYANTQNFGTGRYADGRFYIKNFPSLTMGDRSIVSVQSNGSRTVPTLGNGCGFSVVRSSASSPITALTSISVAGTSYTVGSLPVLARPPLCPAGSNLSVPTN